MESKLSKAQQEAKMYVDKHKLEQLIGEMLNSLVHAKDPYPIVFMIKYLAGLCKEDELAQNGIIVKGNVPQPKPLVKFPMFPDTCNSLLKKHLSREVWDRLKDKKTKHGNDFYSSVRAGVEHIEHEVGVLALDEDAFVQFEPLFSSIAEDLHSWNRTRKHKSNMSVEVSPIDPSLVPLLQVRFSRNFEGVPFPTGMNKKQRTDTEAQVRRCLEELGGTASPVDNLRDPLKSELAGKLITVEKPTKVYESSAASKDWPEGRSVWSNGAVCARLNFTDHLEVFGTSEDGDLKSAFDQALQVLQHCEQQKPFAKSQTLGYLTADLSNLGCALQLKAKLTLPNADPDAVLKWAATSNVSVVAKEDGCFEATLTLGLGKSEADLVNAFAAFLGQAVELNGEPVPEGNTLLNSLVSSDMRKSLMSRSILSVPFRDLIVRDPNAEVGVIAKHAQCYSGFMEAFEPIINHLHGLGMAELGSDASFEDVNDSGLFIRSSRVRFSRNIAGDVFVPGLNSVQRKVIMTKVKDVLDAQGGQFWDLENAADEELQTLNQYFPIVPSPLGGDYSYTLIDWPQGRGVWVSEDKRQVVMVNFRDHIEVIGLDHGSSLKDVYNRCLSTLEALSVLTFESHQYFGYLTTSPKDIGSGMKASVYIRVPLAGAKEEFKTWAAENKLAVRAVANDTRAPGKVFEVSTTQKLKPSEGEVMKNFVASLQGLVEWEQKEQVDAMPVYPPSFKGIVKSVLTKELWDRYKSLKTQDWFGFYQLVQVGIENPEMPLAIGILMPSVSSYSTYQELVDQLLQQGYGYAPDARHSKNLSPEEFAGESLDSKVVKSAKVSIRRNVANFPLCGGLNRQQRLEVEANLRSALEGLTDKWQFTRHALEDLSKTQTDAYISKGVLFPRPMKLHDSAHIAHDWPEARVLYLNSSEDCYAWVNAEDHLQLTASAPGGNLKEPFTAVAHAVKKLEESLQFAYDDHYGYYSTNLGHVGTGLTVTLAMSLEKSSKQGNFEAFCRERGLEVKKHPAGNNVFLVENTKKLGVTEVQCVEMAHAAMKELVDWEKQLG